MNIQDFKQLDLARFSKMSLSELQYYEQEADKLLANMTAYDMQFLIVVDAIHTAIKTLRG